MAEIMSMQLALKRFPEEALSIYTNKIYVSQIFPPLKTSAYIVLVSAVLDQLLKSQTLICQRNFPILVGHIRDHTALAGPLLRGNRLADAHAHPLALVIEVSNVDEATRMHSPFHLNAEPSSTDSHSMNHICRIHF